MPGFCPKCGDHVEMTVCDKCGESAVANKPIRPNGVDGYVPSAFGGMQQTLGVGYIAPPPPRREQATALYDFMPQDTSTQLRLEKGEKITIIRKDADGWWFVLKGEEKGLVPGSYLQVDNPLPTGPDPAILAAREASNQRFNQWKQRSNDEVAAATATATPDAPSSAPPPAPASNGINGLNGSLADARANDGVEDKPKVVRRLKKCKACNETILGRTGVAGGDIFHEICLICRGCRETIEETEEYAIMKKKAYHKDCAAEVNHCQVCDKEILGRVYKAGGAPFHKLCMICSKCQKTTKEEGAVLEKDKLVCGECEDERKRKEAEILAAAKAAEEARAAEARRLAEARAAEVRAAEAKAAEARAAQAREVEAKAAAAREAEAREAEARAAEARAAEEAAQAEEEARLAEEAAKLTLLRDTLNNGGRFSTEGLDQFDLGASHGDSGHDRMSDGTDFDYDNDYGGSFTSLNGERDSLRLSTVIDFGAVQQFNDLGSGRGNNPDRLSQLSDFSNSSDNDMDHLDDIVSRPRRQTAVSEAISEGQEDDEERVMCGGCSEVLEGEAVGALNQYFHYECFKCGHCRRVIAEDDGYAEKDDMAFHQECYQTRFGKRCCRCEQILKGKVVKALDSLYHPDCFVCYQCNASLSESFFEHEGQAVCAQCKHSAITANAAASAVPEPAAVILGTVGYHFAAQDETQLTIKPGQQVTILQKDDDGWWLVELQGRRGYVPGSYLIEHPPEKRARSRNGASSQKSSMDKEKARAAALAKEREKEKEREREREREREQEREKARAMAMAREKEKERELERARAKAMGREKERERERMRMARAREKERDIENARARALAMAREKEKNKRPAGLCGECGTQNPDVARFCRSCGNGLMAA